MREVSRILKAFSPLIRLAVVISLTPLPVRAQGELHTVELESEVFGNARYLRVWTPPGYADPENRDRRYPVVYLNDGQNLFDAGTALFGTEEWRVDETASALITEGRVPPFVVVGIDNAGRRGRAREYLPYPDEFLEPPEPDPMGSSYDEFLADEVLPFVEARFRVARDSEDRVLGGSSYGALVALHVVLERPDLFSRLLLESPSFYVDDDHVLRDAAAADLRLSSCSVLLPPLRRRSVLDPLPRTGGRADPWRGDPVRRGFLRIQRRDEFYNLLTRGSRP